MEFSYLHFEKSGANAIVYVSSWRFPGICLTGANSRLTKRAQGNAPLIFSGTGHCLSIAAVNM